MELWIDGLICGNDVRMTLELAREFLGEQDETENVVLGDDAI